MNTPIASDPLKAPVFGMPTEVPQGSVRPLEDPVRGFVHDVRTPLGAVRGFAEVILDDPDLDVATRTEFMQTIIREADRAIELVRQLGDLARVRRDPLPMGPVGILPGVVEPVLHEMQELASGEGVDLVTEVFACPVTLKWKWMRVNTFGSSSARSASISTAQSVIACRPLRRMCTTS